MSEHREEKLEQWINAHLDGRLTPEQEETFQRAVEKSPPLQRRLQQHGAIDESVQRLFAPPPLNGHLTRAMAAIEAAALPKKRRWLLPTAIAAVLAIAAGAGTWYWIGQRGDQSESLASSTEKQTMEAIYKDELRRGFTPSWVCESDQQFAMTTWSRFDEGTLLSAAPDVKALGWTYCYSITGKTAMLLAKVKDQPVITFVDQAQNDDHQTISANSGLHLFRRQLGKLVLYEVSPLSKPYVLDLFHHKDIPEEWKKSPYRCLPKN